MAVGKAIKAAAKATGAAKAKKGAKKVAKKAKAGAKKVKGKVSEKRAARKAARGKRKEARKAARGARKEGRAKARAIKKGAKGKGKASGVSKAAKVASASSKKKKASSKPTAGAAKKKTAPLAAGMYAGKKGDLHRKDGHATGRGGKDYEGTGMYGKKGAHMMDQPMMADSSRLKGAGSEGDPGFGGSEYSAAPKMVLSKHMKGGPLMSKYKVGTGGKKLR